MYSDGQILNLDLQDAEYKDDTAFPTLSLCKLLKDAWKSNLTQDEPYAVTPGGDKITLFVGNDNVRRLPHGIREGDDTKPCASAAATAAHLKYGPVEMMDTSPIPDQPRSYGASMAQFTEHYASPATSGTTWRSTVLAYNGSEDSTTSSSCGPDTPRTAFYLKRLFNRHNDEPVAKGSPRRTPPRSKTPLSRYRARSVCLSPSPDHKKAAKANSDPRTKHATELLGEMRQAEVKARKRDGTIKT